MKSLVVYYSYGGATEVGARAMAEKTGADLCRVHDVKRPNIVGAFLRCIKARGMKATPIQPLGVRLEDYDHITLMAPVWAGFPAPAIYNVMETLPQGATVMVWLVSGSGKSACRDQVTALIESRGCTLEDWRDIGGQ